MKFLLTMMTQRFDMKFVESEKYHKGNLPQKIVAQSHMPSLMIELKVRGQ